jgi:hypothetical protein
VLLAGLVDFGPQSAPSQEIMHAVAEKNLSQAITAWHCCLEFFSVSTRLPPEYRLTPADAARLLEEEVFARMVVQDLPPAARLDMIKTAAHDGTAGGRVYDAHVAEIARTADAEFIVTSNRRHFLASLRHGIRVETPEEFSIRLKKPKRGS